MNRHLRSMSAGQWLRGVGAALALLGLLVGVPLALLRWGDWPITGLPTGHQLRDLPSTAVSDGAVIGVFTVALWVVWALFALCVAAEIVAEVRGRDVGRLRAAGPLQGLAGRLVATVAMTAGSLGPLAGTASAAPPVRPKAEVAAPAPVAAVTVTPAPAPVQAATRAVMAPAPASPPAAAAPVTVIVAAGDTAWRLAEVHLGDGARWGELWALNQGRRQPDGEAWTRPELIRPGWRLDLPAVSAAPPAAPGAAVPAAAPAAGGGKIVVEPDDNPWSLAEAHLGDGTRWRELFALNRGRPQPDGGAWVEPGTIRPGWLLAVPGTAAAEAEAEAEPAAEPDAALDLSGLASAPAAAAPESAAPADTHAPVHEPEADAADTAAPAPDGGGHEHEAAAGSVDDAQMVGERSEAAQAFDDERDMAIRPLVWLGIPAVLAGGIALRLDALRRRRMRTRRRRAPAEAVAAELQPTERRWRAIAERESAEWVDTTLRYLTWAVRTTAAPIDVVGVSTGPRGVALLLDGPAAGGAPRFVPDPSGWAWSLQCDDLDQIRGLAADESPYAPGLVTLGTSEDGTTVLVDLERLGLLSAEGDGAVVRDWLAGVALDVATAPWAADVDLRLVGGLTALAALEQVGVLDADAVPAAVQTAVAATDRALGDHATTQAARAGSGGEPWPPLTIVVADGGLDPATARAAAAGRGAAVVAAGPVPGAANRLVAGADGHATLYPYGLMVRLSGVDPATAGDTARLLTAAAGPAPATGGKGNGNGNGHAPPAGPLAAPLFAVARPPADVADDVRVKYASLIRGILAPGEIEVVVLGRPSVTGWQADPRQRSVEIVCYLAVHDGPVSGDRLRDCIFPPGFKATSLRQAVSRTRTALGRAASGDPHILPAVKDGSYELGPGVRSDAGRLQALLTAARTAPEPCEVMLLRTALALVRAQPFSDTPAGGYGWASAEGVSYALERQVTDAAHRLGELAFAAGDARLAEWAARQGQRAVPRHEGLYCHLALARLHQGDVGGFTRIRREAEAAAAADDALDGLQPETEAFFSTALAEYQTLQRDAAGS
ncbi:MAG TPA: bacterial transcriptional activator domain-containing protein [Acidimicrobiales bacterium]|nr:bacterial transcriptional activator domain-containing protein [Acidimicrobiales bacterium]